MIERMDDVPAGVIGLRASGKLRPRPGSSLERLVAAAPMV
jgi:hypothetical protein